jgi:hypothetical protein
MGVFDKVADFLNRKEVKTPPQKIGRNDLCWCGSGKKYKHCHLRGDESKSRSYVACGKS